MCGIAGFFNPKENYLESKNHYEEMISSMSRIQRRRGPDDNGVYLADICGLAHTRLSIVDLTTGHQPIVRRCEGKEFAIVYNGETYNTKELKDKLASRGWSFSTASDTEVPLTCFTNSGPNSM